MIDLKNTFERANSLFCHECGCYNNKKDYNTTVEEYFNKIKVNMSD